MLSGLFGVLAVLNLIASGTEHQALEWATKPLLMPVLALWVWRNGGKRGVVAGLLLSAGGDIALLRGDSTVWFIAGMVLFLGAHVCYIATFVQSGARVRPAAALAYAALFGAALVWLWKPLGAMAIPVTVYGLVLAGMATLAAGMGWRVALGGGLFFVSDLLIAIRVAQAATIAGPQIWVMLTYLAAQLLIALGTTGSGRGIGLKH
ncbi:lysoplasmalogenase [Allorhizocola rhizosphaerae]|uniref:lysoplasmalogenase n=1 Tax=Allorhizocola rhizosphaerae TaxID=1872709 RepID=UPI000E3C16C9|nr:lysoplasmalogenase [Allorhizocola rhizosphaerae]